MNRQIAAIALLLIFPAAAIAQFDASPRFQLSETVRVDEAEPQVLAEFSRFDDLIAAGQFDETFEILDRLKQRHGGKLVLVEPGRYVPLREYCHVRTAALPPEALAEYRRRVDPAAQAALTRAIESRDESLLAKIVDDWFCSSSGDDALLALGDLALERGDVRAARRYWLSLFESPPTAVPEETFQGASKAADLAAADGELLSRYYGRRAPPPREQPSDGDEAPAAAPLVWYTATLPAWQTMSDADAAALVRIWKRHRLPANRLAYPGTNIPLAEIRARLILADVTFGALDAAAEKVVSFRRLHPTDRGTFAGQNVVLADRMERLLAEAHTWPPRESSPHWPTFAQSFRRDGVAAGTLPKTLIINEPSWRAALGKPAVAHVETDQAVLRRQPRIGEHWDRILSSHAVVKADKLFVAYRDGIAAFNLQTGRPAWSKADESPAEVSAQNALIYRDDGYSLPKTNQWLRGVPRHTLSIHGDRLIARVGPPVTGRPTESRVIPTTSASKIVVLDISESGQGGLACDPIEPGEEGLAFDGVPVTDGRYLYAVLRRSDVRPEILVACYDLDVSPPRQRWQIPVAAAQTPGSGQVYECTHNLLSLVGDTLYLNTNLGAVAAIATSDGRIRWLHAYPHVKLGDLRRLADTGHFYRDLTPCLLHHDLAIVAPFDSPAIFALDTATGMVRWTTDAAPDAIHLLGVAGNNLWVSGDRAYSLDVASGRLFTRWPNETKPDPRGIGRGVIVGDSVLWPTRDQLFVWNALGRKEKPVARQEPINWTRRKTFGGNVLWASGRLVVTTDSEVVVFPK